MKSNSFLVNGKGKKRVFVAISLVLVLSLSFVFVNAGLFDNFLGKDDGTTGGDINLGNEKEIIVLSKISNETYKENIRNHNSYEVVDGIKKDYLYSQKRLIIKDSYDEKLIDIELRSNYEEKIIVMSNESLIAEFNLIDFSGDYLFDNITFYDVNDNYSIVNKNFKLKYKLENEIILCDDIGFCSIEEWKEFSYLSELPNKNSTIGLFIDLKVGEKIEWVIEKEGYDIYEWALVEGTNYGFVSTAPTADPSAGASFEVRGDPYYWARALKATSPSDAVNITEIGWYHSDSAGSGWNYQIGLYSDDGTDEPNILLWNDTTNSIGSGWNVVSGLNIEISGSTTYWLAILVTTSGSPQPDIDAVASGGPGTASLSGYSTLQNDWGSGSTQSGYAIAIYSVYGTAPADSTPPTFVTIPSDESIIYGTNWSGVYFNATDETGFGTYSVNDSRFSINSTGFLDDVSILAAGAYSLNITINDTSGNENSTIYTLTVNQSRPDLSIYGRSPINYGDKGNVFGTGCPSGLTCNLYRNGTLVNNPDNSTVPVGSYEYVYNTSGNTNYTSFSTTLDSYLYFDGDGDKVSFGDDSLFSPSNTNLSFIVWAKPESNQTAAIVSKGAGGNYEYALELQSDGTVGLLIYTSAGSIHCNTLAISSPTYNEGQWNMFYGQWINGTSCSISVNDGELYSSTSLSSLPSDGTASLQLGERGDGARDFNGSIANFVFMNDTMDSKQITRYYQEFLHGGDYGYSIPVLSYHQIRDLAGYDTIVNISVFEEQMNYLYDNGFETITYNDYVSFVNGETTLPNKPIIIVFDDGFYNVYSNAFPIMENLGFVGVDAFITENEGQDENQSFGFMTWAQVQNLSDHGWEIAGHGASDYLTLSEAQRIEAFNSTKNNIIGNISVTPYHFVYPFLSNNATTDDECSQFYTSCMGENSEGYIYLGSNLTHSDGSPQGLRRLIITNVTTIDDFKAEVSKHNDNVLIDSMIDYNSGAVVYDISGNLNDGDITTATWNNELFVVNESSDTTPPTFTSIPSNDTITYGELWDGADFDATDEILFDSFSINDTGNFQINSTGFLNWTGQLAAGNYYVNVSINDSSNNINWTIYHLNITKATITGSLTTSESWTITYGTEVTIGYSESNTGDSDIQYEIFKDGATIETGETWTPAVGTYTYVLNSTGLETYQNYTKNSSIDEQTLTVNKAIITGSLSGTSPITYGTTGDVEGTESNTGDGDVTYKLYRDGIEVLNPDTSTLAAGTYNYVYNSSGGANYSTNSSIDTFELTINKASSQTNLTFDKASPQDYLTEITPYCSVITGDGSATLEVDGNVISSGVAITLAAGEHTFNCSLTESTNYSYSENTSSFTINQINPYAALTNSTPLIQIYPTEITIGYSESNTGDGDVTYVIYRDGVSIGSGETWTPSAGSYNYVLNTTGGTNYTSNSSIYSFTLEVSTNAGACDVLFSESSPLIYGNTFYVWSNCDSTFTLYRNGTEISNNSEQSLGVGIYNFSVQRTDTENYSNVYDEELFTINQATPTLSVSGTSPITYGTAGDVEGTGCPSGLTCNLYRGGIEVSNPDTSTLAAGTYNYVYNTSGNENYTSDSDLFSLTIDKSSSACQVLFNETSPIVYPATFLVWSDCNTDFTLYRNDTEISNNSEQNLSIGSYNFTVFRTDTINYTNIYDEEIFVISNETSNDTEDETPSGGGGSGGGVGVDCWQVVNKECVWYGAYDYCEVDDFSSKSACEDYVYENLMGDANYNNFLTQNIAFFRQFDFVNNLENKHIMAIIVAILLLLYFGGKKKND